MASKFSEQYVPKNNAAFKKRYPQLFYVVMGVLGVLVLLLGTVIFQIVNRPLPSYYAALPDGETKYIKPYTEPNLLSDTILRWASKAATSAYTFDFVNYNQQINATKPFFNDAGWRGYLASVRPLINTIVQRQLFVYGVVSGTPVISNQGPLPGKGYVWQIQIPFLVTYQAAETSSKRRFIVRMNVVRVPTTVNPQGIGIDQFAMISAR
jgi:intracellular multiplication protein IcmL